MKRIKPVLVILAALLAGFILRGWFVSPGPPSASEPAAPETWTCSMHPQIKLPKPGQCPICFMDLIPLESGSDDESERELSVSPYAARLMELETATVSRQFMAAEVRMVGKVDYDETRVSYISAWVPGRLDRLFVDYTGVPIRKGDHLAELYSPELLTAQEELIQAAETLERLKDSRSSLLVDTAEQTLIATREKLRLWGFTHEQVADIEKRRTPRDQMTIYSPASGIVIHKSAQEGMYVQTGTPIYTIADLSRVWVQLDAYESDLNWLRYGGQVEFMTETYPGKTFGGTISFIDPIIHSATRTAKVRVIVDNADGRLKPGMFVRAVARPKVASDSRVMNADLAGKWISPMHPEVIKDAPGPCDVCGMPLVTAESLGYVAEETRNAPLLVPAAAALKTGKRAVVYVEVPHKENPTYEGREVVLGARLGDFYVVDQGLEEGERVVTRGAFKLDAELQIQARPSMMTMAADKPGDGRAESKQQTHCPVMGGEINRDVYVDHNGMRIYFCCSGCDAEFQADPEKYIARMRSEGVEPEIINRPQTHCPVMGGKINPDIYTDYKGMRIYFCCAGCDAEFQADPETYLKQMRESGVEPEPIEPLHDH